MGNKAILPSIYALHFQSEAFSTVVIWVKTAKNIPDKLAADSIHVITLYRGVFYLFIIFIFIIPCFWAHICYQPYNQMKVLVLITADNNSRFISLLHLLSPHKSSVSVDFTSITGLESVSQPSGIIHPSLSHPISCTENCKSLRAALSACMWTYMNPVSFY